MRISRKDILAAIDCLSDNPGDVFVHHPTHKRYEIRVTRKLHGIDIRWALPGKFFNPEGKKWRRVA
jgi:hypothetical protein